MALSISTTSPLPVAEKDFGYAVVIQSAGGTGPYAWTLKSGSLPPGLTFDNLSVADSTTISGTPTAFGVYNFVIEVEDITTAKIAVAFQISVEEKRQLVSFSTQVLDPATGLGVQVVSITAEIYDVQHQLRETFVFPVGIDETQDAGGYHYNIMDFDVSDNTLYKGNFLHVKWTATTAAGALSPWWEMVPLAAVVVPAIDPDRQPYCSLVEAARYFEQLFDKSDRWAVFNERETDQLLALVAASDQIDQEKFKGFRLRVFEEQRVIRQFPRYMPLGERARGLLGDSDIPIRVQYACCEQALWLLEQRQNGHDMQMRRFMQNSGVTAVTRGTQQESFDLAHAQHSNLCPDAFRFIQPYLATAIDDSPGVI